MKIKILGLTILVIILGLAIPAYSSDWDKVGKAAAIVEGVRILTGGEVDVIGNLVGINKSKRYKYVRRSKHYPSYGKIKSNCSGQVWVPTYVWSKKYVPEHKEYRENYGEVIVEGHYIRYKVKRGGNWKIKCDYPNHHHKSY